MADAPFVIMLAGPNGAGKTTTAMTLFRERLGSVSFVNADVIAQGLSGGHPDSVALQAGAIMLERLHALANDRRDLAFETTGASRSFAPWLRELKQKGYQVFFYYFWLPSAEMAVERVARRVRRGGHHVPEETIHRRYDRGLQNFFKLYQPLATEWEMIDNSGSVPRGIAKGREFSEAIVEDGIIWKKLLERYGK